MSKRATKKPVHRVRSQNLPRRSEMQHYYFSDDEYDDDDRSEGESDDDDRRRVREPTFYKK